MHETHKFFGLALLFPHVLHFGLVLGIFQQLQPIEYPLGNSVEPRQRSSDLGAVC